MVVRIRVNPSRSRPKPLPRSHDGNALAFGTLSSSQGAGPCRGVRLSDSGLPQEETAGSHSRRPRRCPVSRIGYVRGPPCHLPLSERWTPMQDSLSWFLPGTALYGTPPFRG